MKKFNQVYTIPPAGQFALDVEYPKTPHWYNCRENFASQFTDKVVGFFYSMPPYSLDIISKFIGKFEKIIEVPSSLFVATNKVNVLWFEPTEFWRSCLIRRSLLTALLRCAVNYKENNFDEVLFSPAYNENRWIRETKEATLRFLYGYTHWTGSYKVNADHMHQKYGWHEEFRFLNQWEVRKRLIAVQPKEVSMIGVESLWA